MIGLLNVHGSSCRFVRYPGYTCTTPFCHYGGQVAQLRVFGSWQWAAVVGEGWAQITSGRCSVVEVERGGGGLSRSSILFSNLFLHDPCIATYGDGNMQNLIEVIDWYTWPAHPTYIDLGCWRTTSGPGNGIIGRRWTAWGTLFALRLSPFQVCIYRSIYI